jgi:ketosteroid isomerase-like protein
MMSAGTNPNGRVMSIAKVSSSGQPDSERQEQRNKETIGAAFARCGVGGDFFDEVMARDVALTIAGNSPAAGAYNNRDDFLARVAAPFARRLSGTMMPTVLNIWADGDHVIVRWDGVASVRNGRTYNSSHIWILRMKDGKAVEVTAFLDPMALLHRSKRRHQPEFGKIDAQTRN